MSTSSTNTSKKLFFALLILLVWLPLPLASNRPWAWSIFIIGVNTLAVLYLYTALRQRIKISPSFIKAKPIFVVFGIWLLFIFIQIIPLPIAWIETLSPQAAFWHDTQFATLSVDPYATLTGLLKSITYVVLFALILLLTFQNKRLRWLAYALILSGFFQAFYGSFMTLSGWEYGFFHDKIAGKGVATGTFINRNHFANYLVLCLAIGIGILIAQLEDKHLTGWRQFLHNLIGWLFSLKIFLRFILVFMVIALVLTHSRMGNTAFFASLMITGVIALLLSKQAPRATVTLLISLIVIDLFIVGTWFGLERVVDRLEQTTLSHEHRDEVNLYTLDYWKEYPLIGSGLGSFSATFPAYQGEDLVNHFSHAHNDYAQFAVETGVIGLGLMGIVMLMTFVLALRTQYVRRNPLCRGLSFSVLMCIIALLIHSLVEFNLQIPANAATFMVILALGWVTAYLPRTTHSVRIRSLFSKMLIIFVMLGLIYTSYLAALQGGADMLLKQGKYQIQAWSKQEATFVEWTNVQNGLNLALVLTPNNPDVLEQLGKVYNWHATHFVKTRRTQRKSYLTALTYFQKAAQLRPVSAESWAHVAWLKHRVNQHDTELFSALKKANRAAPWNLYAQKLVLYTGLGAWADLPDSLRSQLINVLELNLDQHSDFYQKIQKQGESK